METIIIMNGARYRLIPADDMDAAISLSLFENLAGDFLEYAEYIAGRMPSTVRGYRKSMDQFRAWLKARNLDPVIAQHWIDYYISLKKRGVSIYHARNQRNNLKKVADWLVDNGYLPSNPLARIKPEAPDKNQPLRAISLICMQKMLDTASRHPRDYALLLMFKTSGCRKSDMVDLTWERLNLDDRIAYVKGKGKKHRPLFFSPDTAQALRDYRKTLPAARIAPAQPVWVGNRGALGKTGIYQIFKRTAAKAGVKQTCRWNPHAWRHRWARTMDSNGMTTPVLQYLLGHASIETTQIYTHPEASEVKLSYDKYARFK